MSALIQVFLLLAVFAGISEMCGSVQHTETTTTTVAPATGGARKRRSVEGSGLVHIEFQTTLTSAGDAEFSKIDEYVREEFGELLNKAHQQVATGVEGGSVLKYMAINADCGAAQL